MSRRPDQEPISGLEMPDTMGGGRPAINYGMNIDEGLVTPAPYTIHPDSDHDSISGRQMPHATGEGSESKQPTNPSTVDDPIPGTTDGGSRLKPTPQWWIDQQNRSGGVTGPVRDNTTGEYHPRESQPK